MTKQTEALKSALEAMESFQSRTNGLYEGEFQEEINAIKEALAQLEHLEPVAWMSKDADIVYASIQVDGCFHNDHIPLYTTPPQRTWVGLMRGVRVEGDTVVITVKGGNDAARELCGELLKEKNT